MRSSARKRKRDDDDEGKDPDSDHEFERILRAHEKQLDEVEREKEERRAQRKAAAEAKKKKEQDDEQEHQDYCETCQQGGEVILCDTCPRAYHLVCVDPELTETPEGEWSCPYCEENGPPEKPKKEEEVKGNVEFCMACNEGGFLLCCDTCPSSYHAYCCDPPLKELPGDPWSCQRCTVPEPKNRPEKYISWRWKLVEYPEPVAEEDRLKEGEKESEIEPERFKRLMLAPPRKLEPRKDKEFFIKWKYMSYWHSEWIPEYVLDVHHTQSLRMFWRKNDPDNPPEVDEISDKPTDKDPLCLEYRFYRHGVKPEWMQIHRIINHSQFSKNQFDYLIKWRELTYDMATWESDDFELPNFDEVIMKYWMHRERMIGEPIPKHVLRRINKYREEHKMPLLDEDKKKRREEKPKKVDPKKHYEEQPEYVTATGGTLHPYQMVGLNWLRHCWSQNLDAILADEMGLGKTVQAMTFLYSLMKDGLSQGPFLIAAPLSTIINWEREAEFWAPDFYVVTYVGEKASRTVLREHEFSHMAEAIKGGNRATRMRSGQKVKFHVLLTSYECINMDKATLSSIEWDVLVVDEAHRLKNNQSLFFRNLRDYSIKYKLLLTGTPLQNNLDELFHLLNFLSPDTFTDLEAFTHQFADISKEDQVSKLHDMLGPHMLRRMKADVLTGMPSKSELIVCVDLAPQQKKYYRNILTKNFEALSVKGNRSTQMSLMNVLMELKKCCNHPYLFAKAMIEAPKTEHGGYEGQAMIKACGKFELLVKMLAKLKAGGHRVLIFSQMTRMMDIMEELMDFLGYKFERIDGNITGQVRQDAIDRFNAPGAQQFVFLLSTRAGGLGINLATADTVIIYDSDWNPHNDIQAFSRAHRIGQRNHVMIYRFVTRNSVEERITTVAKKKMLLTHLVVRAGNAQKGVAMSKNELDDVLRWGTEELFKEEDDNAQKIVWDDGAVDALLQRGTTSADTGEKKDWSNDYLSSFKVAQYVTRETEDQEEEAQEEEEEAVKETRPDPTTDSDYWEKLLRHHYEQEQEVVSQQLGKGKRIRRQVNYAGDHHEWNNKSKNQEKDDDYSASNASESDTDGSGAGGSDEEEGGRRRHRHDRSDEKLPPLLGRVGGQLEVLGFNPRQRRAFYNAVMRFGMPASDAYKSQWLTKDLRQKSEKVFKAYSSLFMRHLCEPGADMSDHFNDGVPREGLNRQIVLSRIGIMSLIRRKVQEFQRENGLWSVSEVRDKQLVDELTQLGLNTEDREDKNRERSEKPTEEVTAEKSAEEKETSKEKSVEKEKSVDKEKEKSSSVANDDVEMDETSQSQPDSTELPTEPEPEEPKQEVNEDGSKRPPPFQFNIADGGFTELHTIWQSEEKLVVEKSLEFEVWNRRHDYWLLCGFSVHGYLRLNETLSDPRFALLNLPFKRDMEKTNFNELRNRFIQRRFKLLEQALAVEEQLRRASNLEYGQKPPEPKAETAEVKTEPEKEANGAEKPAENAKGAEKSAENGTPAASNGTVKTEATAENGADKKHDIQDLQKKYIQLDVLTDANQTLVKEAMGGNRQAAIILNKTLTQLEDILNDMKADVSRLPATVAQLPTVCERLEMSERQILNRLTTRDSQATSGVSPLPEPGAFGDAVTGKRFHGIQPKFASVVSTHELRTPTYGLPETVSLADSQGSETAKPSVEAKPSPAVSSAASTPQPTGDSKPAAESGTVQNGTATPAPAAETATSNSTA